MLCFLSICQITLASVTMAVYKSLFLEEQWEGQIGGEQKDLIKKNGKFYITNERGEKQEVEEDQIQNKKFIKSPLPQVPAAGYTGRGDNYSKMSLQWIRWEEHKLGRPIQNALSNRGEYRVMGASQQYRLDGFDEVTKTAYEFNGQVWFISCVYSYADVLREKNRALSKSCYIITDAGGMDVIVRRTGP